jgi:hypothetical protein
MRPSYPLLSSPLERTRDVSQPVRSPTMPSHARCWRPPTDHDGSAAQRAVMCARRVVGGRESLGTCLACLLVLTALTGRIRRNRMRIF